MNKFDGFTPLPQDFRSPGLYGESDDRALVHVTVYCVLSLMFAAMVSLFLLLASGHQTKT